LLISYLPRIFCVDERTRYTCNLMLFTLATDALLLLIGKDGCVDSLVQKRRQMLCSCSSESTMYYCYMQCRICWHYTTSTRTSATYHRQLCVFSEDKQLICLPVSKLFQCSFWLSSSSTHLPYLTTVLMTGVYRTHVCHELSLRNRDARLSTLPIL
jgi:hypothetical protein